MNEGQREEVEGVERGGVAWKKDGLSFKENRRLGTAWMFIFNLIDLLQDIACEIFHRYFLKYVFSFSPSRSIVTLGLQFTDNHLDILLGRWDPLPIQDQVRSRIGRFYPMGKFPIYSSPVPEYLGAHKENEWDCGGCCNAQGCFREALSLGKKKEGCQAAGLPGVLVIVLPLLTILARTPIDIDRSSNRQVELESLIENPSPLSNVVPIRVFDTMKILESISFYTFRELSRQVSLCDEYSLPVDFVNKKRPASAAAATSSSIQWTLPSPTVENAEVEVVEQYSDPRDSKSKAYIEPGAETSLPTIYSKVNRNYCRPYTEFKEDGYPWLKHRFVMGNV
ncbi:transcription initiation factor TFIID subunit 1-like [Vespula squamosa]|uniref:Transcription initiation factor TFIID subunit 1-like n=1 Tax=Vespula squamosa TaxID=30214 RepID=A0ABD1ZYB1_VESSQ